METRSIKNFNALLTELVDKFYDRYQGAGKIAEIRRTVQSATKASYRVLFDQFIFSIHDNPRLIRTIADRNVAELKKVSTTSLMDFIFEKYDSLCADEQEVCWDYVNKFIEIGDKFKKGNPERYSALTGHF